MAADINHVVLVGRLTRDAELKYTNSGLQICSFSVANNYRKKQGDNWVEEANFFNCFMMGRRAEALHRYLTKGTQVGIEGALRYSKWETDGQPRSKVEVMVNEIQLFGGRSGAPRDSGSYDSGSYGNSGGQSDSADSGTDFEDDVPF